MTLFVYIVAHVISIVGIGYGFYADDAEGNVARTVSSVLAALFSTGVLAANIVDWDILAIPIVVYILTHIYTFVADVAQFLARFAGKYSNDARSASTEIEFFMGAMLYAPVMFMCLNMIVFALNEKGVCKNLSAFGFDESCIERVFL
jgi:hypothetical protein